MVAWQQGESGAVAWGSPIPTIVVPGPWGRAPWDRPRVRVSQQEAGRPELMALQGAVGWAEVRALGRWSMFPSVLVGGPSKLFWILEGHAQ